MDGIPRGREWGGEQQAGFGGQKSDGPVGCRPRKGAPGPAGVAGLPEASEGARWGSAGAFKEPLDTPPSCLPWGHLVQTQHPTSGTLALCCPPRSQCPGPQVKTGSPNSPRGKPADTVRGRGGHPPCWLPGRLMPPRPHAHGAAREPFSTYF